MYNVYKIRQDFPLLQKPINGKPLVYLDTAASAQKPQQVLDKILKIYTEEYANPHRGTYYLADRITAEFEQARQIIGRFINAHSAKEIIFTRNATESINLVAATWGIQNIHPNDEILISEAEHHANLVPWQHLCKLTGAKLKVFKVTDNGDYAPEEFTAQLTERTKLVAVTAMSNVLGTIFPVAEITKSAHQTGAKVLVDACQLAVHHPLNVQQIDCDFMAFSGHKTYGPTGIGVLYGRAELLENMPPYQFGGDMIDEVSFAHTTFTDIPARFEAGTAAFAQAIGMAAGLQYMQSLGLDNIVQHETELVKYTLQKFADIPNLKIIGTAQNRGGVFSFTLGKIHPQDLAFFLNKHNIAIRVGHHCAQPIVNRMGYTSLARASFGLYTTKEEIDNLITSLIKAEKFFRED